jgi:hypothetical protein
MLPLYIYFILEKIFLIIMIRRKLRNEINDLPFSLPQPKANIMKVMSLNKNVLSRRIENKELSDAEGLRKAYNEPNRIYVNNDRMYVAGTTWTNGYTGLPSLQDAWDDLKIPFHQTRNIQRYKDADEVLKNNPNIKELIGHSMGSSVILQLNSDNNDKFITRTYSAPVLDLFQRDKPADSRDMRFRTLGDPVAIFDNNAITVLKNTTNPFELHSYDNYGDIGVEQGEEN